MSIAAVYLHSKFQPISRKLKTEKVLFLEHTSPRLRYSPGFPVPVLENQSMFKTTAPLRDCMADKLCSSPPS